MVKLARASAVNFAVNILETVVGAVATLYFARVLGAGPMGSYFLALGLINWLLIPSGGVSSALLKRVSEGRDQDQYLGAGVALLLAYFTVIVIIILLVDGLVNEYVEFNGAVLVAGGIVTLGFARLLSTTLRGKNRVEFASVLEGIRNVTRAGLQLTLIIVGGLGLTGLLAGEILAAAAVTVVLLTILRPEMVLPRRRHFVRLYEYGRYSWFGNLKVNAYSWTDTLILGLFVSTTVVGTYEIAWRVSALFILLPAAIGNTVFPTISKHARDDNLEPIRSIIRRTVPLAPALAIPGAVGALVLGPEILSIYGPEFTSGAVYLLILSLARIIESVERLFEQVLNALDYPERTFRIAVVFITVNTVLNFGLVLSVGAIGAAVATLASTFMSLGLAWYFMPSKVMPTIPVRMIGTEVASAGVMGLLVHLAITIRSPQTSIDVVAYIAGGATIYGVGLLVGSQLARDIFEQFISEVHPF